MGIRRIILKTLVLTGLIAVPVVGEAASVITITPVGTAAYSITATDLQESAGIDLSIAYDATALSGPQVTSGALIAGAYMVPNVATPGHIRIGIVTGGVIKGSGELVAIAFTRTGTAPAPNPILRSSVYSAAGLQLAVQSVSAPPPPDSGTISGSNSKGTGSGSGTAATGGSAVSSSGVVPPTNQTSTQITTAPGTVSLPQEPVRDVVKKETPKEEPVYVNETPDAGAGVGTAVVREQTAASGAVTESAGAVSLPKLKEYQSVLDRFRLFKGVRSVDSLAPLFDVTALQTAGIKQSPATVVSDGMSRMTVALELSPDTETPSFSLKGANIKSIRRVSEILWELDALPQKGKADVRLSIITKGDRLEIPLVVVPPLGMAGTELAALPVAALDAVLAKPLKNGRPAYDLNADGVQNYLDDYILLAHWLLKQGDSTKGVVRKPAAAGK